MCGALPLSSTFPKVQYSPFAGKQLLAVALVISKFMSRLELQFIARILIPVSVVVEKQQNMPASRSTAGRVSPWTTRHPIHRPADRNTVTGSIEDDRDSQTST